MSRPVVKPSIVNVTRDLFKKILEEPKLVSVIQSLPAPVLNRVIHHVGLEDAGELVALATTEQLIQIFDEDLWKNSRPGQEEKFDASRFATWLNILSECGAKFAADRLQEMEEDEVTFGLSQLIWVVNTDELMMQFALRERGEYQSDLLEKAMESSLGQEFEAFWVFARSDEAWDAIAAIFLHWDENHHDFFIRLMERLCGVSQGEIEDNGGLYQVLTEGQRVEVDAAFGREQRRERAGYVSPQAAAQFLHFAETVSVKDLLRSDAQPDPVTRAYWRNMEPENRRGNERTTSIPPSEAVVSSALWTLIHEAEVETLGSSRIALGQETVGESSPLRLHRALAWVHSQDLDLYSRRMSELSFLANVLVAGASHPEGRRFRLAEAAQEAVRVCEQGLIALESMGVSDPNRESLLVRMDLVTVFKLGKKRCPTPF